MKTVIIGGSAHSTPALFDTPVALDEATFSFSLVGRDAERLAAVGRAIDVVGEAHGYTIDHEELSMLDLASALVGADVIVVQIRTGGYASREWDERFPLQYGLCGDEGLGIGGLASAWRTWPELRALLTTIASVRPQAVVLILTSPLGILTRCALRSFPELKLYGMCELPWTTLVELCGQDAGVARSTRFSYVGVNHVGWFSDVRIGDRVILGPDELRPLKYVALAEALGAIAADRRTAPSRANQLEHIARAAFQAYTNGSTEEILAAVRSRATPWYAHALAPFLAGVAGRDAPETFFLTHRNMSYCDWLDDDQVIEMPFTLSSGRLDRTRLHSWTRGDIAAQLASLVRYEAFAADVVHAGDPERLPAAIGKHPWLHGVDVTAALVRDVLARPPSIESNELLSAALR